MNETSVLVHSQLTLTAEGCGIGMSDVHCLEHSTFTFHTDCDTNSKWEDENKVLEVNI